MPIELAIPEPLSTIVTPAEPANFESGTTNQHLLISAGVGFDEKLYDVDTLSRAVRIINTKAGSALIAAIPQRHIYVFLTDDYGEYLSLSTSGSAGGFRTFYSTNTWLRNITRPKLLSYDYTGLKGERLKAWVALPLDYLPGKKYPTVLGVYEGVVMGDAPPRELTLSTASLTVYRPVDTWQLLTEYGYAVLIPSMPLPPLGHPRDPYADLTDGVLPAISQAVALGFADPNRIGVIGHSFGGFSVMGLITQTNRFKAAVEENGASDFVSDYGVFSTQDRYGDNASDMWTSGMAFSELQQFSFSAPLWVDPKRYWRNSPIRYVQNVETSLLLIHSDLDEASPIQQSEEFYNALWRQGKRAEFIRYWGEDHVYNEDEVDSIDMWRHIIHWFKTYL
jgi:dipeptidyl aminopeptidase/acylaminoacyl peptidase